jgi:putative peptidoglycan lipid II flippase
LVQPGSVLADRYVVEDLLAQEAGSESWRARDRVLARSVVLQLLPSTSPNASRLLSAAKRASRVADTRILQVLDAADNGSLSYIVREWANGQSLDVVLSEGPLPARRATWLMREVAAAMVNAHRMGLPHGRLVPDCVVVTKSSGVKLIGLGTSAVLRGGSHDGSGDAELDDTLDLGRLLYACLTARWPGGAWHGLPAAPTEHGRLLRPRQVRAGVPRALDEVCDRILSEESRCGDPITTVVEVKDILTTILADEGFASMASVNGASVSVTPSSARQFEPPPALLLREGESPSTGEQPVFADGASSDQSTLGRTLMWTVGLVLVLSAVLLAYLVGQHGKDPLPTTDRNTASSGSTSQSQPPGQGIGALKPLTIAGVVDFDPVSSNGSGDENPEEAPFAVDGDPGTSWQTMEYFNNAHLGGQKPGVGLVVDLGSTQTVGDVKVLLGAGGTGVQLRAAPAAATSAPMGSYQDYRLLDTVPQAQSSADFALSSPVRTRYLLVWLTALPADGTDVYRGQISEIQVLG